MKRLLLSVWLLSLSLLSAVAENYPYKSDVLWVTVPNHADWLYKTGEKVTVEVQFYKYGIPRDNVSLNAVSCAGVLADRRFAKKPSMEFVFRTSIFFYVFMNTRYISVMQIKI